MKTASRCLSWLLALARWLMPGDRREWSEAMRAEIHYVPRGARFSWAAGCLFVALEQRFASMDKGGWRVTRGIMAIELLGCFGPATLAWWEFMSGPSGLMRMSAAGFERLFFNVPGGDWEFGLWLGFGVAAFVSVIGLCLGLRYVVTGKALRDRVLGFTLLAVLGVHSLAGTVSLLVNGVSAFSIRLDLFVLLTLLPAAAIAHLLYLGETGRPRSAEVEAHDASITDGPARPENGHLFSAAC